MTILEGAHVTRSLATVYATRWSPKVAELLFAPDGDAAFSLDDGDEVLSDVLDDELQGALLPLSLVDERSMACVVLTEDIEGLVMGSVVRVHLDDIPLHHQFGLLDIDPFLYVESLESELHARDEGMKRVLDVIGPAYLDAYLEHEKRPRDFVVRPVRLACQNVIVALGAIAQDSTFDGLSVQAWQTCEVPHVATHEANRALAALTLADAFQNGGTMEIRFDRPAKVVLDGAVVPIGGHPEGGVPASLKRFARTKGVTLGGDDPASISPAEARALFLAITPMPSELRQRVDDAVRYSGVTPERLCFTLLSQTWREIELDFILACSARASSILEGGADWRSRSARQAEMEVARTALMAGMLYRRLNGRDAAGSSDGPRVVEDLSLGVGWQIVDRLGAVYFTGLDQGSNLPWSRSSIPLASELLVFFRSAISADIEDRISLLVDEGVSVALAVPMDAELAHHRLDAPVLRCPDRTADLDRQAEARLLTARISRA